VRALRDFLLAPASGASARTGGRHTPAAATAAPAAFPAADATPSIAAPSTAAAAPGAVGVLCAAEDAHALGVAAAGLLVRRARASCALVCVWITADARSRSDARPPASRAARRLAGALTGRGHDALACGRAAVVALPADPDEALTAAARAAAAAGAAPTVLVLGGPRPATFDDVIAAQDGLLVVSRPAADTTIGALAVAGLPAGGPPRHACTVALGTLSRAAAAAGLATPAALRRALDALDGDGS
jgi:hypothetical protein